TSAISTALTSGSFVFIKQKAACEIQVSLEFSRVLFRSTGGGSTVTVAAGTAAPGTYTLTVTGTATSAMHSATVTLTVTAAPPPNDFSITASRTTQHSVEVQTDSTLICTPLTSNTTETINLTASGARNVESTT